MINSATLQDVAPVAWAVLLAVSTIVLMVLTRTKRPEDFPQARGRALDAIALTLGVKRKRWLLVFHERDKTLRARLLEVMRGSDPVRQAERWRR